MSDKISRLNEYIRMLNDEKQKVEGNVYGPVSNYKLDHDDKWRGNLYENATHKKGAISGSLLLYKAGIDEVIEKIEKVKLLVDEEEKSEG